MRCNNCAQKTSIFVLRALLTLRRPWTSWAVYAHRRMIRSSERLSESSGLGKRWAKWRRLRKSSSTQERQSRWEKPLQAARPQSQNSMKNHPLLLSRASAKFSKLINLRQLSFKAKRAPTSHLEVVQCMSKGRDPHKDFLRTSRHMSSHPRLTQTHLRCPSRAN